MTKSRTKCHLGIVVAMMLLAVSTTVPAQLPLPNVLKSIQRTFEFNRNNLLFYRAPLPCSPAATCSLDAKVIELFDVQGKLAACAVNTNGIEITYGLRPSPSAHALLAWNLTGPDPAPTPTQATYAFEKAHGILIIKDDHGATNGKADSWASTRVTIDHKFKRHGGEVEYYPLVIQTRVDGTQFLCAAGDPKITND